jgi:hypothetical protein
MNCHESGRRKYMKIPQKGFEVLQPNRLLDLAALGAHAAA